ncbi:hypothetical protein B0H19DRAFT_1056199 [Mycena capillaripes]|nr:hypothetical protein B0H19DRAFT_1056199 [Mycena capillaripes]
MTHANNNIQEPQGAPTISGVAIQIKGRGSALTLEKFAAVDLMESMEVMMLGAYTAGCDLPVASSVTTTPPIPTLYRQRSWGHNPALEVSPDDLDIEAADKNGTDQSDIDHASACAALLENLQAYENLLKLDLPVAQAAYKEVWTNVKHSSQAKKIAVEATEISDYLLYCASCYNPAASEPENVKDNSKQQFAFVLNALGVVLAKQCTRCLSPFLRPACRIHTMRASLLLVPAINPCVQQLYSKGNDATATKGWTTLQPQFTPLFSRLSKSVSIDFANLKDKFQFFYLQTTNQHLDSLPTQFQLLPGLKKKIKEQNPMPLLLSGCPGSLYAIKFMAICVSKAMSTLDNFPLKWLSRSRTSFLGGHEQETQDTGIGDFLRHTSQRNFATGMYSSYIHTNLWRQIFDNLLKSGVNCGRGIVHPNKEVLPSQHVGGLMNNALMIANLWAHGGVAKADKHKDVQDWAVPLLNPFGFYAGATDDYGNSEYPLSQCNVCRCPSPEMVAPETRLMGQLGRCSVFNRLSVETKRACCIYVGVFVQSSSWYSVTMAS